MQNLEIVNADKLLYQTMPDIEFIVDGILPTGLHLFCGASKVGKSWLMLDLAIKVSKGEEMWNLQTKKADVLYFSLEDTYQRLQKRLQVLTDEIDSNLHFVVTSKSISNGFIKKFADENKIAIILVHHLRKQEDNDVFNMISGTTGIMGSADTTFILKKKSRDDSVGILSITGRDVEYQTFILKFDSCRWSMIERSFQKDIEIQNAPEIIFKIIDYVKKWENGKAVLLN